MLLRPYQEQGIAQIFAAWREGARSVLAVLPTGGGKTQIFTSITDGLSRSGLPSLINVHRRELATQAANRLREFGTDYGFILHGEPRRPTARVQIASVQTLVRRAPPPAKLVINDEAHLSTAGTWQKILANYPDARILGVTATPWRLSGKPLAGAYDACVVISTPRDLCTLGFLAPYSGFSYKTPDLSGVKTTAGDYNEKQSAAAMSDSLIVDNIVEQYVKHARELSAIVFAVTVDHSRQLTKRFVTAGISAEHLDGETPRLEREAILRRMAEGRTMVLCNVGVAVEGLDIPRLKCCILARPTKSLARAIQMMGRVRRPWNGVTARIHDHAFVIRKHGLPDQDRDYQLNSAPELPPNLTVCEVCMRTYQGARCPSCDHENAERELGDRSIQTVETAEEITFSSDDKTSAATHQPELLPPVEIKWNSPGRVIEGTYEQSFSAKTDYGMKQFYRVIGKKRVYHLPGTKHLNAFMSQIVPPCFVRIAYLEDQTGFNGKFQKRFRVEADDGK